MSHIQGHLIVCVLVVNMHMTIFFDYIHTRTPLINNYYIIYLCLKYNKIIYNHNININN